MENNILNYLQDSKVEYDDFVDFVCTKTLKDFLVTFRYPFLVGQDLHAGELGESTDRFGTVQFQSDDTGTTNTPKFVSKSVYTMFHNGEYQNDRSKFHIGRLSENEITIVDYTISKQHAIICLENGKYRLTDLGAKNGTSVDGNLVQANTEVILKSGDEIQFGRIGFVWKSPIAMFIHIRQIKNMEATLQKELIIVLQSLQTSGLIAIANSMRLNLENTQRKYLILRILKYSTPQRILEHIF